MTAIPTKAPTPTAAEPNGNQATNAPSAAATDTPAPSELFKVTEQTPSASKTPEQTEPEKEERTELLFLGGLGTMVLAALYVLFVVGRQLWRNAKHMKKHRKKWR